MSNIISTNAKITIDYLDEEDKLMLLTDYSYDTDWDKLCEDGYRTGDFSALYAKIGIQGEDLNLWSFFVDARQVGYENEAFRHNYGLHRF